MRLGNIAFVSMSRKRKILWGSFYHLSFQGISQYVLLAELQLSLQQILVFLTWESMTL